MSQFVEQPSRFQRIDDSEVNYGALATNFDNINPENRYYITTAIAYTNGYPHMGHAYEFMTTDIIARYRRLFGYNTFVLTGTDEHGQKVAASAEKASRSPKEHCDIYVEAFKALDQRIAFSYSRFIRTTDENHIKSAQQLWLRCAERGDIYLDSYEGWYNEREEVFVTDSEAEASNFLDPGSGLPLKRVTEASYFFRMSAYCEELIRYVEENPSFIQPEQYRNNILARLKKEGLKDLSVSRTTFDWGIPVPEGFDSKHVMYVWFDALSNYFSGINGHDNTDPLSSFWPANCHIIGKDIIWFHCVIWPCILLSAKIPLPESVYSHGFVNASDGRKMSKSYNNTVDPHDILDKYSLDSFRYYVCSSITYGADLNFSESGLISMHNSELADILGNLVHRALNLGMKYCDGKIPDTQHDPAFALPFDFPSLVAEIGQELDKNAINLCLFKAMEATRATNRFLTEAEPWKMKGEQESRRPAVVRTTLEALYYCALLLAPVLPFAAQSIFAKLGTSPQPLTQVNPEFYNLKPGTAITVGDILFTKKEAVEVVVGATSTTTPTTSANSTSTGLKKGNANGSSTSTASKKKGGAEGSGKNAEEWVEDPLQPDFSKLDIRVGKIVKVWAHESADRLYCEEIDIGDVEVPGSEEGSRLRPVASGLRQHYRLEELDQRLVLMICNLKEAKMQGFLSTGMVLAAKSADGNVVELLQPPAEAKVGDRIILCPNVNDGDSTVVTTTTTTTTTTTAVSSSLHLDHQGIPWPAAKIKKMKIWEKVVPDLRTNEDKVACWQGIPLGISTGVGGLCRAPTLMEAQIS